MNLTVMLCQMQSPIFFAFFLLFCLYNKKINWMTVFDRALLLDSSPFSKSYSKFSVTSTVSNYKSPPTPLPATGLCTPFLRPCTLCVCVTIRDLNANCSLNCSLSFCHTWEFSFRALWLNSQKQPKQIEPISLVKISHN